MRGENVACSIATLHYALAVVIIVDAIIFMAGFYPLFVTKLPPTAYNILLTYFITAGSLLHCRTRQKPSPELVRPIRQPKRVPPREVPSISA